MPGACPERLPTQRWVPSPEDQARLDAGITFECTVFGQLIALRPYVILEGLQALVAKQRSIVK
jgi:hypothetical protein